jgi:hypothetical protein
MIKSHGFIFSANPGTDVTHFFGSSLKVGQRRQDYRGVSMWKFSGGSPGWIRMAAGARQQPLQCLLPSYD